MITKYFSKVVVKFNPFGKEDNIGFRSSYQPRLPD
ncbi:hypothetical protein SEUBUCD646_0M03630 [Saccharomyces eubayanus]|uniref:Uncharacterized protein n=1 Tax=Saccharomyces eubayanus TaxID=1080349 RepID=A0ABN8VLJ2_SACEU|nr:MRPL44-like protein [Saccharomyces eubayanus]KOG97555.1 MRPL44-like protein [Saccharomyces eubayanus]CAI1649666.1 hypothetical protein SEUBUCD650_0M03570 [Saccharomyces eubayanus]CAI1679168.1 hypothetical protein SEUBUCD646_0M03630 [Saccharomyces eubayanus]